MRPYDDDDYRFAVIYPVRPEHLSRLLNGKTVFCKYIGRHHRIRIREGSKLLFYESGGSFEIRGESEIAKVEFLLPDDLVKRYGKKLFLTGDELAAYTKQFARPPDEHLLVLSLRKVTMYQPPLQVQKAVTMSGLMLSEDQYWALKEPIRQGSL